MKKNKFTLLVVLAFLCISLPAIAGFPKVLEGQWNFVKQELSEQLPPESLGSLRIVFNYQGALRVEQILNSISLDDDHLSNVKKLLSVLTANYPDISAVQLLSLYKISLEKELSNQPVNTNLTSAPVAHDQPSIESGPVTGDGDESSDPAPEVAPDLRVQAEPQYMSQTPAPDLRSNAQPASAGLHMPSWGLAPMPAAAAPVQYDAADEELVPMMWAVMSQELTEQLSPDLLPTLANAFEVGGATSIYALFQDLNGRNLFGGPDALNHLKKLAMILQKQDQMLKAKGGLAIYRVYKKFLLNNYGISESMFTQIAKTKSASSAPKTWAQIFPQLTMQLPPEALSPLRTAFQLNGATSIQEFFDLLNNRNAFQGPSARQNLVTLKNTLKPWKDIKACQDLAVFMSAQGISEETSTSSHTSEHVGTPSSWAILFPKLTAQLPPEALKPLKTEFSFGGAAGMADFFDKMNGRNAFQGPSAHKNLLKLQAALQPWANVTACRELANFIASKYPN